MCAFTILCKTVIDTAKLLVFLGIYIKYNIFLKNALACKESLHFILDVNLEDSFAIIFLLNIFLYLSLMSEGSLRYENVIFIIRENAKQNDVLRHTAPQDFWFAF